MIELVAKRHKLNEVDCVDFFKLNGDFFARFNGETSALPNKKKTGYNNKRF